MEHFKSLTVELPATVARNYPIQIGSGLIDQIASKLQIAYPDQTQVLITDDVVAGIYLDRFKSSLDQVGISTHVIVLPSGEQTKSISHCQSIWQQLAELPADRSTMVVALGGGVIGDLAGFIAATYARGLRFIQIPTTLLAQVDSSVGGKVGVNLPQAKNMVGAFWQPEMVFIDPAVLRTLDERNYRSGLAEVVKYGVIHDPAFFQFLENSTSALLDLDNGVLIEVIANCCRIKAQIVAEDEKEISGRRAILNYGHTWGHAIETVFGYGTFLHGEAVAIGMTCAARLAASMGMLDYAVFLRQTKLLKTLGLPTECPPNSDEAILSAMKRDKKVDSGVLKLILPTALGSVQLVPAPDHPLMLQSLVEINPL